MAEKKKTTKPKTGRIPTLAERITDNSVGSSSNVQFIPKKKKK